MSSSPILGKDGALVGTVGMVTDITERKQAEDKLRRSADRLTMLHDMDQAILAAQSPVEIGRAALGRVRRMVSCQRCTVTLFDFARDQGAADRRLCRRSSPGPGVDTAQRPRTARMCSGGDRSSDIDDLTSVKDPPAQIRSCWLKGCGRCCQCRSW